MADLAQIPSGTSGWDAIVNSNSDEVNATFSSMLNADKETGDDPITDPIAITSVQLIDSTGGTPSNTINDVGASFSQSAINNNFASIVDELNKVQAELESTRNQLAILLAFLRQTGGVGLISD